MKVYQVRKGSVMAYIRRIAESPEEALVLYAVWGRKLQFRQADLHAYGMNDDEIEYLTEKRFLREVEVSRNEALSIAGRHKMRTDPLYREMILDRLEVAQKRVTPEVRRKNVEKARQARKRGIKSRRQRLLKSVLIPHFGGTDEEGNQIPPEEVSIQDVVDMLEQYPRLLSSYPINPYMGVFYDLRALEIPTAERGDRIRRSWRRKLENDPELLATLQDRIQRATEVRMRVYEEDPERARDNYRRMVEARNRKLEEDPEFRAATMERLAKGNPALWEKYRTDPEFRERFRQKQLKGLEKGMKKIQRRAARRRTALLQLIEEEFDGDLIMVTGPRLTRFIEEHKPQSVWKHYKSMNLTSAVKKDLARIREESGEWYV